MRVYKYFNKKYKIAICSGLFYINTFANIHKGEEGLINDKTEGKTYNYSGEIYIDNKNNVPKKLFNDLKTCGIFVDNNSSLIIENCHFYNEIDSYIYCVTEKRNDNYWKNIPIIQGGPYDCCIEIYDCEEFAKQLYDKLKMQDTEINFMKVDRVFYEQNTGCISKGTTKYLNPFRKPLNNYEEQKEIRIVIDSDKILMNPKIVHIPREYYHVI